MLTSLVLFFYAIATKSESISQRLKDVKAEDLMIVEQIKNNFMYNIDQLFRGDDVCTDDFQSFISDNFTPDIEFIETGDFQFNSVGSDELAQFFCAALPAFSFTDHFDSSFAVISYDKIGNVETIKAVSKNSILCFIISSK